MSNNNNTAVVDGVCGADLGRPLSTGNLFISLRRLPESDLTVERLQALRPLVGLGLVMCLMYIAVLV